MDFPIAPIVVEILFVPVPKVRKEQKDCNGKREYGFQKSPNDLLPYKKNQFEVANLRLLYES